MYIKNKPFPSYISDVNGLSSDQDKSAYNLLQSRVTGFNEYRRKRLLAIKANIAYLCGEQNIGLRNDSIINLPATETSLVTCNLILPAVVNDVATSTKIPAIFDIIPNSQHEEDVATSVACTKILQYMQRNNPLNLDRAHAVLWYDIDGVGWRKVYWDTDTRFLGVDQETGEAICEGEVAVECVPNSELIYDYQIKNLKKLEWIIHAKRVRLSWVRSRYGADVASAVSGNATINQEEKSFEADILQKFNSVSQQIMTGSPEDVGMTTGVDDDKMVDYYEYWNKPTKGMPTGALIICIGGKIVMNGPYPLKAYPHAELPFVPSAPLSLDGITIGSIPRISQARPIQREYNMLRSLIVAHTHALGNGVMMVPRGANLNYKTISNLMGATIEYDGVMKPTRESGVPLPNSIFAHLSEVRRNIDEVFSFHDPSKGIMPKGGPKSARGLELLQNADYDQLGPIIDELEHAEEKIVYQMLSLAMANYHEAKVISVVGEDNAWVQYQIDRSKLNGKINVIVRRGSSTPTNKRIDAMDAFNVWQSGLIGDPNDPIVRLHTIKQMQLGGSESILRMFAKDDSFAKQEFNVVNQMLNNTEEKYDDITDPEQKEAIESQIFIPPVNSFDNHHAHVAAHRSFIMDNYHKYKSLDVKYVYAMALMIDHMNQHQAILDEMITRNAMQSVEDQAFIKGNTIDQLVVKKTDFNSDGTIKKENSNKKEN